MPTKNNINNSECKTIILDGIIYEIYKKSVEIQNVGIFFFSHKVNENDVRKLHKLYLLGAKKK
jgi:hypothetical protein